MIDSTFVNAIRQPLEAKILTDADDKAYSNVKLVNLPPPELYAFPTVHLCSLDSLVQYVADNRDYVVDSDKVQIHCKHNVVDLFSGPQGEQRVRDLLVQVADHSAPYNFGAQQDLESFRISLLTAFEDSRDRVEILKFISNIKDETIANSTDDGVSQTATVRVGLATLAQATIPSPVRLRPIRTFIEVEQPEGMFLFRMKSDKGMWCSLHEIHTNWKRQAAISVQEYLENQPALKGFTILA